MTCRLPRHRRPTRQGLPRFLIVAALAYLPKITSAQAQDVNLERFRPPVAGNQFLSVSDPSVSANNRLSVAALADYSKAPRFFFEENGQYLEAQDFVQHRLTTHLLVSAELWQRLKIGFQAPFVLYQTGDFSSNPERPQSPSGAALGDLRLDASVPLVTFAGSWPALAGRAWVDLPTGDADALSTDGSTQLGLGIALGSTIAVDAGEITYSGNLGAEQRVANARLGGDLAQDLSFGLGLGWSHRELWLGAEIFGATAANSETRAFRGTSTSVEGIAVAGYRLGDWKARIAGGPGLQRGAGTPNYRLIFAVEYAPPRALPPVPPLPPPPELRLVGVRPDPATATPGDSLGPASDTERHSGQVASTEPPSGTNREPGRQESAQKTTVECPSGDPSHCQDSDGDGIPDADDRCPDQVGPRSLDAKKFGCPRDGDGDGIADADDACPAEPGPSTDQPETSGCPAAVRVAGSQIVIMQRISFESGRAAIAEISYGLLAQVSSVLSAHPEVTRIAIDGHTDNVGSEKQNTALSRQRAVAVMRWLVENGVDERRLEARGFGPRQPIDSNDTEAGRRMNRRVEFTILRRSPRGERDWKDGPADE